MPIKRPRKWGIRHFIVLWISAIVLAFILLCGGLQYAIARQHNKTSRIYAGSQSLQTNRAFEAAIIAEGRQDLLWKTTGDKRYLAQKSALLRDADALLRDLKAQTDSATEQKILYEIDGSYAVFRRRFMATNSRRPELTQLSLDKVLMPLRRHRLLNQQQMTSTMQEADRIDEIVDTVATVLVILSTVLVVVGGIELWQRIFKPTLQLAQAARNFSEDLQARAPVLREDEMGKLARTFNAMAEAIGDREKERLHFVATVAHDLKNPLVVVGGAAHLLKGKEYKLSPEERERWLGNIEKNASKLEALIGDLTDGVQAETGTLSLNMETLDLSELVREITDEHAGTTQTHLVSYDVQKHCVINGDRKRLERVVMNLLSNATKYSPKGREVTVTLRADGDRAILQVQDQGAGIAPEDLPKLFIPFSRLEHTKTMASGTGLGLSSAKKIIDGHGGSIEMQSVLGEGTVVEVCLPLLSPFQTSERQVSALA